MKSQPAPRNLPGEVAKTASCPPGAAPFRAVEGDFYKIAQLVEATDQALLSRVLRKNGLHPLSINIGAAPNSRSSSLRSTAHSGLRARRTGALAAPRKGEVNAWDNEDFVRTVRQTGRKTLIMAGVWTSVCVMFPAVDAKAAGFKVYAVMDASGDPSEMTSRTTLARFAQAGVIPTSTNAVLSETHRTWNRPEAAELAKLYALVAPNYAAVIESYQKAQDVAKQSTGSATK
jgi:hypothetical protein